MHDLRNALKNSSFLAIDTEHVAITSEKDRFLHQVGLAYLPTLVQEDSPQTDITSLRTSEPYLQEFFTKSHIQALTLNINISKEQKDNLVCLRGGRDMPARRSHRFVQEQQVNLEDVEAAIVDFIQSCNNKRDLVLIGFEMAAEWTYLSGSFPQAMPFFSAWVDLRDIAKDITSSVGVIPGLVSLLQIFGYHWKEIQPGRGNLNSGIADNAGDDAVAACALANALLIPENQEKLRFRQECGQIARIFTKKKGYQVPNIWDPFTAIIHTQGPLPLTINSGMKLARHFFTYSPQSIGIVSESTAFITFKSKNQVDKFVTDVHGLALPTGEILSVQLFPQSTNLIERESREQKEKQELRERKRSERTGSEVQDLGNLFGSIF